jgi:polyisoprenoid-binding protein YceI
MNTPTTRMKRRQLRWLLPFVLVAGPAWSDQVGLRAPGSSVELRTYGFGLIPLDGTFTRFQGWLRYDPANPRVCQVLLEIEAGSLAMSSESIRDRIIGPDMMDVARFPDLAFHGTCHGDAVVGDLTMHGQTHPFTLDYTRSGGTIVSTGRLERAEWGITGSPLVGGSTIRIKVSIPDPVSGSHT